MDFIKKNYRYFLFFFFSFFVVFVLICKDITFDPINEYGMSHAIRMGEVPYKDFNTVSTPLFIIFSSLGLFFYDSFAVYLIEACLLYTLAYFSFQKILGKNSILIVFAMCLILFRCFIPTYNTMAFTLIIFLMYLERKKVPDIWIGVVLGLLVLSKQTIGIPVFLITCIGIREWKRIWDRTKGCLIVGGVFILYLLLTGAFTSFFDLCLFGLFDFGSNNHLLTPSFIICTCLMVLTTLYFLKKDSKNILFYYALGAVFLVIPICDFSHFPYYLPIFLIPIIEKYNEKISLKYLPYALLVVFICINIGLRLDYLKNVTFSPFHHFEGTLMYEPSIPRVQKILDRMGECSSYEVIDAMGMFSSIVLDQNINYFDVPLHGNYGYLGTKGMMKKVDSLTDTYFFINEKYLEKFERGEINQYTQMDYELIRYVVDHSEKIEDLNHLAIYYKK